MPASSDVQIRRAAASEVQRAADLFIAARHAAVPAIPPPVHSDAEVRTWFGESVMTTQDVWVAVDGSSILGVMVLSPGWIEHLYVDPGHTNRGIGSAMIDQAKAAADGRLELWTFVSNVGAQRFYERQGFVEVGRTDGDNEEGEPDVRYCWSDRTLGHAGRR